MFLYLFKKYYSWHHLIPFGALQNYSDRAAVRETYLQYIGPLDKYLSCGFVGGIWEAPDHVAHILRLGGQLYFHCGNIIYTKVNEVKILLFQHLLSLESFVYLYRVGLIACWLN